MWPTMMKTVTSSLPTTSVIPMTETCPNSPHFRGIGWGKRWEEFQDGGETVENSSKDGNIPDHHTCCLRNLYAGQEATARTGQGTMTGSKLGKALYCHPAYLTSMQS